jgi:hypothetical protein
VSGGEQRIGRLALRLGDRPGVVAWAIDEAASGGTIVGRLRLRTGTEYCTVGFPPDDDSVEAARVFRVVDLRIAGRDGFRRVELDADILSAAGERDPADIPIPPPPAWYYQSGEVYIGPFDRDIYSGAAAEQLIEVRTGETARKVWVDAVHDEAHPVSGETVYWYRVVERHRDTTFSFLTMPGESPATAGVVPGVVDSSPGEYILRLLASGVGNGDNGVEDVMPLGANLPESLLHLSAFRTMASPEALRGQDYTMQRGSTIREQCEGLFIASGYQLAARLSAAGTWQASLVSMAAPMVDDSALSLTDDDLLLTSGPPVKVSVDGRTVRSIVVRVNHDGDEATEIPVTLGVERTDAGGDTGQPMTLDLPGVVIPSLGSQAQSAAEIVADLRTRVGVPRVRWSFAIRADMPGALALGLGSVVTLTSEHVYGIVPTDAVVSVPCRVLGIRRDLVENRLELEVRPSVGFAGGWAPAMLVTAVGSPTTVTVSPSAYSPDDDRSLFAVGDVVHCVSRGDWSSRVTTIIAGISSMNVITLDDAHGLAVGDTIRHADYAQSVGQRAALGTYAYLADGDGLLDGSVVGKLIA